MKPGLLIAYYALPVLAVLAIAAICVFLGWLALTYVTMD